MKVRNSHAGCCGVNATRPDGSEWAHLLTLPDGSTVQADTAGEALEELIPRYADMDADARRDARVAAAHLFARNNQATRIADAQARGLLDPVDPDEAALVEILNADKSLSLFLEVEEAPGRQAPWVALPELVLVTTSYAPHTRYPPIAGNVVWLDPTAEGRLLQSLQDARILDYWAAPVA